MQEFIIFSCRLVGAVLSGKAYVLIIAEEVELGDVCGGAAVEPVPERSETQVLSRSIIPTTCAVVIVYGCPVLTVCGS